MPGAAAADVVVEGGAVVGGAGLVGAVVELTAPDTRSVVDGEASGLPVVHETSTAPRHAAKARWTTRPTARSMDMAAIKANGCTNPLPDD
jgi:hypothetical protein